LIIAILRTESSLFLKQAVIFPSFSHLAPLFYGPNQAFFKAGRNFPLVQPSSVSILRTETSFFLKQAVIPPRSAILHPYFTDQIFFFKKQAVMPGFKFIFQQTQNDPPCPQRTADRSYY
jgi:hypothetical protein